MSKPQKHILKIIRIVAFSIMCLGSAKAVRAFTPIPSFTTSTPSAEIQRYMNEHGVNFLQVSDPIGQDLAPVKTIYHVRITNLIFCELRNVERQTSSEDLPNGLLKITTLAEGSCYDPDPQLRRTIPSVPVRGIPSPPPLPPQTLPVSATLVSLSEWEGRNMVYREALFTMEIGGRLITLDTLNSFCASDLYMQLPSGNIVSDRADRKLSFAVGQSCKDWAKYSFTEGERELRAREIP